MSSLHDFYRPLGQSGPLVSPLGLGTVKLGRNQGVKYPTGFNLPDDASALNLLAQAKDLGINLLDTAPAYGISEERLGTLLQGQRQDWVIASKVGEEFEEGRSWFDFSATHTRFSVERSLKRLNTNYLDMVLVHSDGNDLQVLEQTDVYSTLAQLKQEGKIGQFGFSGKTVAGGLLALEQGDCAMVTFNLNEQDEKPVLDYAAEHGKAILIKKALASGHICLDPSINPIRASFDLVLGHPGTTSAVVGTITPKHLHENVTQAIAALTAANR
ncbi:MAG: aldo/keto reductase [Thiopseudomonas sp.]|nr:aldo/keto reductase [Thiopseudomonas sp.]MCK9466366.1 aldo/keto reductase [Thiopseudomonas sp.]